MITQILASLHQELTLIRTDLHMDDLKSALVKVNDLIQRVEDSANLEQEMKIYD